MKVITVQTDAVGVAFIEYGVLTSVVSMLKKPRNANERVAIRALKAMIKTRKDIVAMARPSPKEDGWFNQIKNLGQTKETKNKMKP